MTIVLYVCIAWILIGMALLARVNFGNDMRFASSSEKWTNIVLFVVTWPISIGWELVHRIVRNRRRKLILRHLHHQR